MHLALVPTVICDLKEAIDPVGERVIGGSIRRFVVSRAAKNGHLAKAKAEKNRKRTCDFIYPRTGYSLDY